MVKRFIICGNMTIEKIYKLTIKNSTYNLTEEEITSLYESCRKALNISYIGPIPSKPFDNPITPMYPTWPTPYVTSKGTDNSVMDTGVFTTTWSDKDMSNQVRSFSTNIFNNPSPSTSITFISDDMEIIKENDKWRESMSKANSK